MSIEQPPETFSEATKNLVGTISWISLLLGGEDMLAHGITSVAGVVLVIVGILGIYSTWARKWISKKVSQKFIVDINSLAAKPILWVATTLLSFQVVLLSLFLWAHTETLSAIPPKEEQPASSAPIAPSSSTPISPPASPSNQYHGELGAILENIHAFDNVRLSFMETHLQLLVM